MPILTYTDMERFIQIVEDDADIRFIVEYILEDASYIVETFENAKSFINRARKENVDLIILDVMLPDGNGIELSKDLKSHDNTSKIPIIIMSAHANIDQVFKEGKADEFIKKPFDLEFLVEKVGDVLKASHI
jgi:two-component system phosphate regulon response regulator PhoB